MMSITLSRSEIRICLQIFQWYKLHGKNYPAIWQHKPLIKEVLISFGGDAENFCLGISNLFANIEHIYLQWLPKIEVYFWFL